MIELLNLEELGARLRVLDRHLVALLAQRMSIGHQVGLFKQAKGYPIVRSSIEEDRLRESRTWAEEEGLNPHFVHALFYFLIDETCKTQIVQLQERADSPQFSGEDEEVYYATLKRNLLTLTECIAPVYDRSYDRAYFATHSYLDFENRMLEQAIALLPDRKLALDLGCATGGKTFRLARDFSQVIGYDLSPAMIEEAGKKRLAERSTNARFEVADLDDGIPQADGSTSMVVMTLGTASDIRKIDQVMKGVERILKPGGVAFLSFYNREALLYRWGFLPWPVSLAAEINLRKHCLDVHFHGQVFSVYARAYSMVEIQTFLPPSLKLEMALTFPTVSSILPNEVFENDEVRKTISDLDSRLAESSTGAYIIAVGKKL